MNSMRELWNIARQYGTVRLSTSDDGTYYCAITFQTIEGVNLEANSGFRNNDPEEAIKKAIKKAEEVTDTAAKAASGFKRLT